MVILTLYCRAGIDIVWLNKLWLCFFSFWILSAIINCKKFGVVRLLLTTLVLLSIIVHFIQSQNLLFSKPTERHLKEIGLGTFLKENEELEIKILVTNILKESIPRFKTDPNEALALLLHYNNELNDSLSTE